MAKERIEDVQKFRTHQEKARVYGEHLQERLQAENPQRVLIGRMTPGFEYDEGDKVYTSTFYLIGEEANVQRRGLGMLLLRNTKRRLKVLVKLNRVYCFGGSAIIFDASLREPAERIMRELDEKSGEKYSSKTRYSTGEDFSKFRQVKMPSCEEPFL